MSPYGEHFGDRLHDAEDNLNVKSTNSSGDGSIEFTAAACGSTKGYARRIEGCARAYRPTFDTAVFSAF
jgi:hypothetical protein